MDTKELVGVIAGKDPFTESFDRNGCPDGYFFTGSPRPEMGFHFGYFFYLPASLREQPVLIVEGPAVGEIGPMDVACRVVAEKAEQVCCPFHLASSAVCPCGCGRRK